MIDKFYITGDTHGVFNRFHRLTDPNTGVIILGDAGLDYFLDDRDVKTKLNLALKYPNIVFYLVRGNHEARPENLPNITEIYDEDVGGNVYILFDFPQIRYLKDGGEYIINGKKTVVIGGAYSIDKEYRLEQGWSWFSDEQLSKEEQLALNRKIVGKTYDLILSHTCPYDWRPIELFLSFIDQRTVDNSMEHWLNEIKDVVGWKAWAFGHYHGDKKVQPGVHMLYSDIVELESIFDKN